MNCITFVSGLLKRNTLDCNSGVERVFGDVVTTFSDAASGRT